MFYLLCDFIIHRICELMAFYGYNAGYKNCDTDSQVYQASDRKTKYTYECSKMFKTRMWSFIK